MNKNGLNEISLMQFIFLIHGAQLGVGMFQIPLNLAKTAGTDGWITLLICWIISTTVGLLVIQVMKKNPDKALPALMKHYFGKWIGSIITILFIIFFTFTASTEILRTMLFVKGWLLPQTPDYVIMVMFAIPGYWISSGGVRSLSRFVELVFYLSLWMPFFYLYQLKEGNWLHLLPLFKEGVEPVMLAIEQCSYSFFGSELAFVFYPMLKKKQLANVGMIAANTLTLMAYLLATLVCFIFFSPDEILRFNEPALSVLKTIEFHFIERLEIILLAFYLLVVYKTWMSFVWSAAFCTSQLWGHLDYRKYLFLFLSLIVIYTFVFNHEFSLNDEWQKWLGKISLLLSYAFPVCLYAYGLAYDRFRSRCVE